MRIEWDEAPDLNITPLVDVMLVLLAILMVTAPTITYDEKVQLPKGSQTSSIKQIPEIEIRVTKKREVYIKKSTFSMSAFPDNFILYAQKFSKKTPVYIKADKELKYKDVIFILKTVKEAGFSKVSLMTE